jgi:hypothetical protein
MKTIMVLIFAALTLNAQAPATKPDPAMTSTEKPAPAIPDSLRAKWWRAVANLTSAQAQMKAATDAANSTRAEIEAICSPFNYEAGGDANGEPVCVPKSNQQSHPK